MLARGVKKVLGLDLGQGTAKAVVLDCRGTVVRLGGTAFLDRATEGILGDDELLAHLRPWLQAKGWHKLEAVAGIPQYQATVQVADFPPVGNRELAAMVAHESQQMGALSEASFLHSFSRQTPRPGRRNPVCIGICREDYVGAQAEALGHAGVRLRALSVNGIALADAFCHLQPEAAAASEPRLLLDIGQESTAMAVLCGGQVLFSGALSFGVSRFLTALAGELGVPAEAVLAKWKPKPLTALPAGAPLVVAAQALEREVRAGIEQWQSQEVEPLNIARIGRIYVCGGGACFQGLPALLGKAFKCEAEVLSVPGLPEDSGSAPCLFVTAFGLALQGLGMARTPMLLAPPALVRTIRRERRAIFLHAAAALFILSLALLGHSRWRELQRQSLELLAAQEHLDRCGEVIEKLEAVQTNASAREMLQLPLVEYGNRARRYAEAMRELSAACAPADWFIFMADQESFEAGRKLAEPSKTRSGPARPTGFGGVQAVPVADYGGRDLYPNRLYIAEIKPMRGLVAAGYTGLVAGEPYKPVREIVKRLNGAGYFSGVDLLPDADLQGREDIFSPWLRFFADLNRRRMLAGSSKSFVLMLPYARTDTLEGEP